MATPVQVKLRVKGEKLKVLVEDGKKIDISLVSDAKKGDWLLVHGDLAINKISKKEAYNIFSLIKQCPHEHNHEHSHHHAHSHA
jgi:hydrogenase maturation factor